MSLVIRPIRKKELDEFRRVAATALIITASQNDGMLPEFTLCAFEDGKMPTSFGFGR